MYLLYPIFYVLCHFNKFSVRFYRYIFFKEKVISTVFLKTGFIEFIVEPSMNICSELLEHILQPVHSQLSSSNSVHEDDASSPKICNFFFRKRLSILK